MGPTTSTRPSPRRSAASGFESVARPDIVRWKYAKLLLNLGNPVDALCPRDADFDELGRRARAEGQAVLDAAGIAYTSSAEDRARRGDILRIIPIDDATRPGASTWQSLARGLPVEVDHLNGEIVLLGRLHGVPTPVNELLQAATHRRGRRTHRPGLDPGRDPPRPPLTVLSQFLPAERARRHTKAQLAGSSMRPVSPGTAGMRPLAQSALACSMRSWLEATKFHQM